MPLYESTFIARQDLSRQDVAKITDGLIAIVEQAGGKIIKNEYWGLRSLSYKIDKNRKGHYTMLGIDAPAEAVKEVERMLRINENVIRVLTVTVEELTAAPSVMMNQARGDDRPAPEAESVMEEVTTDTAVK